MTTIRIEAMAIATSKIEIPSRLLSQNLRITKVAFLDVFPEFFVYFDFYFLLWESNKGCQYSWNFDPVRAQQDSRIRRLGNECFRDLRDAWSLN
jgi:hypothetical protein